MSYAVHIATPLVEGEHFRRLSVREGGGVYRFALIKDVAFVHEHFVLPLDANISFRDHHGTEWMRMTCRTQTIRNGYFWNGSSPKKGITICGKDFWFGTPDFKQTIGASLKHDADFQFRQTPHYPFSLETANKHFLHLCQQAAFRLSRSYHGALVDFSHRIWESPADTRLTSTQL